MNDATNYLPRWALMWLLAGGLFLLGKMAVYTQAKRRGAIWPMWQTVIWFVLWPGMNPSFVVRRSLRGFATGRSILSSASRRDYVRISTALLKALLGAMLLWMVARHFSHPLAAGWCGMIGLILVLHFGIFDLIAIFWQAFGFRALPIMNAPIKSMSVAEFWGRRWNSAFRDLAHPFLFVPMSRKLGAGAGLWASFAVSGLAHELVISVPAGAGYGLPTVYFLIQALGVCLERLWSIALKGRVTRWHFTHTFTALPAFILFHPPFVERVMIPFFRAIGALT